VAGLTEKVAGRSGTPPTTTLVQRIRFSIEAAIRSGTLLPGDRIPTEHVLMQQYGCARMTVHQAIRELVEAGLVERRKKAGSFVASPRVQTAVLEIPDIQAVISARGATYRFDLRRRERRRRSDLGDTNPAFGGTGDVLLLDGVHIAADRPFATEHRWISLAAVPEADGVDFAIEAPGSWLLNHIPWTEARHRISARSAGAAASRSLQVARSTACLQVERWTWRRGAAVTFVRQLFPGELYDLTAEFSPVG
jgi:GntR family histidine utilization transcriptional repressor